MIITFFKLTIKNIFEKKMMEFSQNRKNPNKLKIYNQ